ncbi:MAG: hypothetical protein ACP59X_21180 [Solidesulfovibrio sp. DCME]|uniref:hypothetical protein n=1 Tax=Solidesulfovibrio sp. DCME TaxID=3447380 RepID=UPI003D0A857A
MGFLSPAGNCHVLIQELVESLSAEDVAWLRQKCCDLGHQGWLIWRSENRADILEYTCETPSGRKRIKIWRDGATRRLLTLAAIHHLQGAAVLLESLDRRPLSKDSSNRHKAVFYGLVAKDIYDGKPHLWPFDGPDPFGE